MKNPNIVYIKPRTPELGDYHVKKNKACCSNGPFVNIDWFIEEVKKECVSAIYEHADKFNNGNLAYPLEDSIDLWFKGVAEKLAQRIKNG